MDKDVAYMCVGGIKYIYHLVIKKAWNRAISINTDGPRGYYVLSEINQGKTSAIWFHFYMEF